MDRNDAGSVPPPLRDPPVDSGTTLHRGASADGHANGPRPTPVGDAGQVACRHADLEERYRLTDAGGRRIAGGVDPDGHLLELIVPRAFDATAPFPLLIDPLIGSVLDVGGTTASLGAP